METHFNDETDALFHLQLSGRNGKQGVHLDQADFVRRGSVDRWLIDPIFGLEQARSREGELAIEDATKLQQKANPNPKEVTKAHRNLIAALADDDPFWPRWLFFARNKGMKL